jgi:hypothetical protein
MVAQRKTLQSMHHEANQCTRDEATQASSSGLASLEKAMAFGAENQLKRDMAMHLAMARPSLHQSHLLFGMQVAFGNHACPSVVWQNAI